MHSKIEKLHIHHTPHIHCRIADVYNLFMTVSRRLKDAIPKTIEFSNLVSIETSLKLLNMSFIYQNNMHITNCHNGLKRKKNYLLGWPKNFKFLNSYLSILILEIRWEKTILIRRHSPAQTVLLEKFTNFFEFLFQINPKSYKSMNQDMLTNF